MDDLHTMETCDECKKPFEILIAAFELAMKDDLPILCSDCHGILLDQQMDNPARVVFKYKLSSARHVDFDDLGAEGWELVAVDNGQAYFKKEYFEEP